MEDGAIVCDGPRAHLFYVGEDGKASFKNFVLRLEVKTTPGSNSGIYFHTAFQESGWPEKGYEAQILNSQATKDSSSPERKMTGSLYGIRNVWKPMAHDNQWFKYLIFVQGKTIRIRVNNFLVVDYTEPPEPPRPKGLELRQLSSGTFALQCHDPDSTVHFRNISVLRFADHLPTPGHPVMDRRLSERLIELAGGNLPLMDLHTHERRNWTSLLQIMDYSRRYGYTCGIVLNCGIGNEFPEEASLLEFLSEHQKPPHTYLAMQAEGREWVNLFSQDSIQKFDYVFTDAMTWTNDDGKRMRLWIDNEVEIGDPEDFMEMLVSRIEGILDDEPIDIYVNASYLPDRLGHLYDQLWTEERMDRVIKALVRNQIAMEISASLRIPSAKFIRRAKAAGVKFTFGTNNDWTYDLGPMSHCLQMIEECALKPGDMWIPR